MGKKTLLALLPREEQKALDFCLAGGDSPLRELVVQLVDRIRMNLDTADMHYDTHGQSEEVYRLSAIANARIDAYRYAIMVACRLDKEAEGH